MLTATEDVGMFISLRKSMQERQNKEARAGAQRQTLCNISPKEAGGEGNSREEAEEQRENRMRGRRAQPQKTKASKGEGASTSWPRRPNKDPDKPTALRNTQVLRKLWWELTSDCGGETVSVMGGERSGKQIVREGEGVATRGDTGLRRGSICCGKRLSFWWGTAVVGELLLWGGLLWW